MSMAENRTDFQKQTEKTKTVSEQIKSKVERLEEILEGLKSAETTAERRKELITEVDVILAEVDNIRREAFKR